MNVLAIETTGTTCGVALGAAGKLLAESSFFAPNMHDALLARCVAFVLDACGLTFDSIDVCAVSSGPGSFTGLRIGMAYAKGLCFDDRLRFVAVPTLEACASAAQEVAKAAGSTSIMALIASHRDLYYIQRFSLDGDPQEDIELVPADAVRQRIDTSTMICGPGAPLLYPEAISGLSRLSPRFVLRAAFRSIADERFDDAHSAVPLYAQDFIPRTT